MNDFRGKKVKEKCRKWLIKNDRPDETVKERERSNEKKSETVYQKDKSVYFLVN